MYKIEVELYDFGSVLNVYIGSKKLTQEEFGKKLLSNRQSVAFLIKAPIEEISDGMLFRLYYYFTEQLDIKDKKTLRQENKNLEELILNIIRQEISKRTYDQIEKNESKPKENNGSSRKRK